MFFLRKLPFFYLFEIKKSAALMKTTQIPYWFNEPFAKEILCEGLLALQEAVKIIVHSKDITESAETESSQPQSSNSASSSTNSTPASQKQSKFYSTFFRKKIRAI